MPRVRLALVAREFYPFVGGGIAPIVAVAMTADGATHVAWLDHNGGNGRLLVRHVDAGGVPGAVETLTPMKTDRNGGYPRLIADGNTLVYAWTEVLADKTKHVRVGRKSVNQ